MRCARTSTYVFMALAGALASASWAACSVDRSPTPDGRPVAPIDAGSDSAVDAGMDSGTPPASLLEGAAVGQLGSLALEVPVASVQLAGEHVLALHGGSGATLLDLSDPRTPKALSQVVTADRAVAVRYDQERQVVFLLTESGELRALRMSDPSKPAPIGEALLAPPAEGARFLDLARAGNRLFALASGHIVPVNVAFGDDGRAALNALEAVSTGEGTAQRIAASGTGLYVALAGGIVRAFSASGSPKSVDEVKLGGEILGWSVRSQRLWVALEDSGVRALWLRPGEKLDVELRASELKDVRRLAQSGQLLAAALDRGRIALLDVSITEQPRGIAVHDTDVPDWIAVAGGNLLYGSGNVVNVAGVPPFVERGVPASARDAAPRHGRIELLFSKPLDPDTITLESVTLRCDSRLVPAIPHLDLDGESVVLLPTTELPASGACSIRLRGVRDALGLGVSASADWLTFKANDGIEGFVHNGPSAEKHTAEGRMTGWSRDVEGGFEYSDIAPAEGVHGKLYVDFDGERMWLFFDALEQRDVLYADCAAVFTGFVASGETRFSARVRGDQRVVSEGVDAVGGYAYAGTQGLRAPHATFELAIEAARGGFAVQLYLPSTSRGCEQSVREPVVFSGMCDETGCTVDGRGAVDQPAAPSQLAPTETTDETPTLRFNISNALMSLPQARVELATQGEAARTLYRAETYGSSLEVPAGVLERGQSYDLRVTAFNVAGISPAATATLTVVPSP